MGKIKPYMQQIKLIEEAGITAEDIRALADLKGGNSAALSYLKQYAGTSADEDSDSVFGFGDQETAQEEYQPEVPVADPVKDWFQDFSEHDPEAAAKVAKAYDDIDDRFKAEVYHPDVFPRFANSIVTGEFDRVYPEAMKIKALNDEIPWLQAYIMAAQKIQSGMKSEETKAEVPSKGTSIPKSTTPPKRRSGDEYDRAWDMDIEELEQRLFS
jgi:hypothetical protein